MAPSSERDQDVKEEEKTSAPKENPFIKFRQFADTHIGTLLQGIIGLPSALKSTSGNTRWADVDDDLRRRDELQAKQRQLKEEDTRRQEDEHKGEDDEEDLIKDSKLNTYGRRNVEKGTMSEYFPHNITDGRDIPLYSPVTKALFEHLHTGDASPNWGVHPLASLGDAFRIEYFPFQVLQTQKPLDDMEAVQFMAYNELNRSTILQSDYSLLPYLLFSPYSPIRLKLEAANGVSDSTKTFPYDKAFEDLIRSTEESGNTALQNYQKQLMLLERQNRKRLGLEREKVGTPDDTVHHPRLNMFRPFDLSRFYGNPSVGWMAWIHNLYGQDLLQQKEVREVPAHMPTSLLVDSLKSPFPIHRSNTNTDDDDDEEDEESELDMYQRFLHWASTPGGIVGALDALCNNPEGFLEKQLKVLESPEEKKIVEELLESKFAKEVKDLVDMLEGLDRQDTQPQKSPTTPPKEPGKIVSSSTTTEHTTHEDGSVETCVTVWKRYADGRESVTTTNHVDNPACDENGNQIASSNAEEAAGIEEKKPEKKGWFWN